MPAAAGWIVGSWARFTRVKRGDLHTLVDSDFLCSPGSIRGFASDADHGGIANAPAYQVAIYGFGYFPGDPQVGRIYSWMGFRVAVIGDLT